MADAVSFTFQKSGVRRDDRLSKCTRVITELESADGGGPMAASGFDWPPSEPT